MIFIIGGNGFVGSAFARHCARAGVSFQVIDRANYADFKGGTCDILINANGNSKRPLAQKEPLTDFELSVESTARTMFDFKFRKYVFLSSCDVYEHTATPQGNEEDDAVFSDRLTRYGFHKLLAEQYVRHSAKNWTIFRLAGMVGEGLKKNAVYDILNGGPLWIDPGSELQYMNTDDIARIAMNLHERLDREVINLCADGVVSNREIMQWAGAVVPVNPGSPIVRHEVSCRRLKSMTTVPTSRETVKAFVETVRAARVLRA